MSQPNSDQQQNPQPSPPSGGKFQQRAHQFVQQQSMPPGQEGQVPQPQKKKVGLFERIKNTYKRLATKFSKLPFWQQALITVAIGIVAVIICFSAVYIYIILSGNRPNFDTTFELLFGKNKPVVELSDELPAPPGLKDTPNPINGELYTKEEMDKIKEKRILAVIVENHPDARPQSGLVQADMVYETMVESGITRYLAFYWGKEANEIGPVRSTRKYHVDWASEFDTALMHIGWAGYESWETRQNPEADARSYIFSTGIKSFFNNSYNSQTFWRDQEKLRQGINVEHTAYTSTSKLWEVCEKSGWGASAEPTSWKFKKDADLKDREISSELNIKFSDLNASTQSARWVYDRDTNLYKRSVAGQLHTDRITGNQITAKNIIVQETDYAPAHDNHGRIIYYAIGAGNAKILRDGKVIDATWKKESRTARTVYHDLDGNEIEFNRGQIWVEIIAVQRGRYVSEYSVN